MATLERAPEKISADVAGKLEIDSFAPSTETQVECSTLVIASYNIRYAVGSFLIAGSIGRRLGLSRPRRRPRLVASHLQNAAIAFTNGQRLPPPLILALQEADQQTLRAGGHHIARELAQELQMNYAYAASEIPARLEPKSNRWYLDFEEHISPTDPGKTGLALLSRLPFARVERIDLPWSECAWRPRLALAATISNGKRSLHVFNSHIDPHALITEQLEQHAAILDRADEMKGPTVLLGDFNTLSKRSCLEMRRSLEARGFRTPFQTGTATWRAGLIRLHTDWIFLRGAKVKRYGVARPLGVSDHWPVWAEIDLSDEEGESV
ncbi:MAG TPA: endonuclease/exonuclease/phosphatase family protein [Pyrinomonadaceae bacterium]|jgi:endonuclease/exonuclease/phosphatase family metal-dependent hydrolase|nr:endonuclease/exonuclease/phosphatase family protein [Pyrinomonadaceae bacterium]